MAGIPQVITEDRASGAQVFEGSLSFNKSKTQYLRKSFSAPGNRKTFTWSSWVKRSSFGDWQRIFTCEPGNNLVAGLSFTGAVEGSSPLDAIRIQQQGFSHNNHFRTTAAYRDTGWYHVVMSVNTSSSTASERTRLYVNGELQPHIYPTGGNPSVNSHFYFNGTDNFHEIGRSTQYAAPLDARMSECYWIDGQALGPEYFGYTDPLTNVWRPKKFNQFTDPISTEYSGASALTWDDNPIGSVYTLSNGNRTATASGGSGYSGADVWSNAIPANSTTAFTLSIINSDSVGGWYFTDSQTASGTHPDERSGNMVGLRNQDLPAAFRGTFATANGYSNSGNQLDLPGCESWLTSKVDFVVYRPASGTGKVWCKANSDSTWVGGGDPSDISSTPSFIIPDGNTYLGYTFYDRSSGDQIATLEGDGSIQQKVGANSFYFPMDGNSPIGKDQSGYGNDFTPINFGGSVDLPRATGAIPILNTNEGGTVAKNGVRTDSKTYTVTASGGKYYLDGALTPTLSAYRGGSYTFDYTGATSHPFYLSSLPDGSHNSKAYSVSFDGTGDYLGVTGTSDVQFGTGAFTAECFVYANSLPGSGVYGIFDTGSAVNANRFSLVLYPNGKIYIDNNSNLLISNHKLSPNTWNHIAFVREGTGTNESKLYINGALSNQATINTDFSNDDLLIGKTIDNLGWNGYISNVRIVKGRAVYTSNFTPPTTTLTNVSNTTLLCCQDSNATTGAVVPNGVSITANGNAAASQTKQPFLYNSNGDLGVNTGTSNVTKITIPHTAADMLYYYCSAHSGMGSSINVTTDVLKADPYAWKCVLAMPLVGGSTDESANINVNSSAKTFAVQGNTAARTVSNYYGSSLYFDGSGDYLGATSNADFAMGTGDFTLECWVYRDSAGGFTNFMATRGAPGSANGYTWGAQSNGNGNDIEFYTNVLQLDGGLQKIENKKWHHVAITRSGNTLSSYVNGILNTTALNSQNFSNTSLAIAMTNDGSQGPLNGYLQDVRAYKGVAKYTENFVVGSTAPDVLPDTPSGVSGKSKLTKITEGAVSFDGSSDYLRIPNSSDFSFGSGNFTVECFAYCAGNTTGTSQVIAAVYDTSDGKRSWQLTRHGSGNNIRFYYSATGSSPQSVDDASITRQDRWIHIAAVRNGGTLSLYVDGVSVGSASISGSLYDNTSDDLTVGATDAGGTVQQYFNGFVSNLRVIKGTALYTSNFTPPTEPLTAVTNTKLLCCQSNTQPGGAAVSPTSGLNDGTIWSSYFTGNHDSTHGWGTLYKASNAFDGNLSSMAIGQVDAVGLTWTAPGGGIGADATTIRIYGNDDNCPDDYLKINGINYGGLITQGFGPDWTVLKGAGAVGAGITQLESVYLRDNSAGNQHYRWRALEIDGTVIVDPVTVNGDAAATNFNPFTDDINAIRGQETGYATWNPLSTKGVVTTSGGNLVADTVESGNGWALSTIPMTSGKYYCEMNFEGEMYHTTNFNYIGIVPIDIAETYTGLDIFRGLGALAIESDASKVRASIGTGSGATQSDWNTSIGYDESSTIGIAIDCDTPRVKFYVNGKDVGTFPYTMAGNKSWVVFCNDWASGYQDFEKYILNAGQKPFRFTPPDGFQPMNLSTTQPEKVIARSDQYVAPTLYTGNGSTLSVNNLNFKPDLIWQKGTTVTGSFSITGHNIHDTVRGKDGTYYKELSSNTANAENVLNNSLYGGLSDITNNGFTVVDGSDSTYKTFNGNGNQYVAWCWKAGGSSNTFNIDDVGYANASDVNMSVGSLNSSVYNQDQTWSTYGSFTSGTTWNPAVGTLFNHSLTSGPSLLAGNTGTWTFTSGITASKSIEIYTVNGSNSNQRISLTVDGTVHEIDGSGGVWINTGLKGSLTAINIYVASGWGSSGLRAIKVDGKELVDAGVSVTDAPSIAATGSSVGTKQGFSIVSYTGAGGNTASIPHGLKQSPEFVIIKNLDGGTQGSAGGWWAVFHSHIPQGAQQLYSFNTSAATDSTWNNHGYVSGTNSSVVNVNIGDHSSDNLWWTHNNNTDYIMYAWHSVPGLQKFGEYPGSGNDNGTFIECGFRPAIVWIKSWNTNGQEWVAYDSKRSPVNVVDKYVYLDQSIANQTGRLVDFVSNGFKFRQGGSGATDHGSSRRYIYMAWAEAPSINLYGAQANAR